MSTKERRLHDQDGQSYPLGATVYPKGVNFSLFSKTAETVELYLFDDADDATPSRIIRLDPQKNRTFYYWHVFVPALTSGQLYGYKVHGPYEPKQGHRFDGHKLLLDPYARTIAIGKHFDRHAARRPGDNCGQAAKCVVVDTSHYDWEGDRPLGSDYPKTVIYELHIGGFTAHPNSKVAPKKRSTYAGLIEKIPYLKKLGITAVELMPVHQFDAQDAPPGLINYWGYATVGFFAPHRAYSSDQSVLGPINEFRDMVKALHKAGIEVILDVVFNHTAEGNELGPTFSFRGLENSAYYMLENDLSLYRNYTGCGNTVNSNHAIVSRLILDCLQYWVEVMHVDGFRFDLASVMSRGESGELLKNPPILWAIESDPVLAGTKIIAEAWDAAGLYQVGSFVGDRWAEWNGQFRDDVRRFVKSDPHTVKKLAARVVGSPDIYPDPNREPNRSIHFITCHDGFTLNDLVSYNIKHNQANGERNRDGADDNYSWNCGVEGRSKDPEVTALRLRQIKNFLTINFIAQGTPMLLMGDEVRRTQKGNNNAYCQDNKISWFDWSLVEQHDEVFQFVRNLIHFIKSHDLFAQDKYLASEPGEEPHIIWHGTRLRKPDWGADSHCLAFTLQHPDSDEVIHVILNAYWQALRFSIPRLKDNKSWYRIIDTAYPFPEDFYTNSSAPKLSGYRYLAQPRSTVLCIAK